MVVLFMHEFYVVCVRELVVSQSFYLAYEVRNLLCFSLFYLVEFGNFFVEIMAYFVNFLDFITQLLHSCFGIFVNSLHSLSSSARVAHISFTTVFIALFT